MTMTGVTVTVEPPNPVQDDRVFRDVHAVDTNEDGTITIRWEQGDEIETTTLGWDYTIRDVHVDRDTERGGGGVER